MSKFLLLTRTDYKSNVPDIVVNVDRIVSVKPDNGTSLIELTNSKPFHVKESFEQVKNLLEVNQ